MITYKDCPNCDARRIHESVRLCEVCEVSEGYEKRLASLRGELTLSHKFHDVAVAERNRAQHLLGEVLAVLNGDGGHAVGVLGWSEATKRGLARHYAMLARTAGCVTYPCDCTYPRDGQPDWTCKTCHGLGTVTKTETP